MNTRQHRDGRNSEFATKHMDEKISLLQDHLPPFLVKNKKIYSILSLGIHELEEDECRSFFPVLRQSTITHSGGRQTGRFEKAIRRRTGESHLSVHTAIKRTPRGRVGINYYGLPGVRLGKQEGEERGGNR